MPIKLPILVSNLVGIVDFECEIGGKWGNEAGRRGRLPAESLPQPAEKLKDPPPAPPRKRWGGKEGGD